MTQQTLLLIGASRGLGLALAQEFLQRGWRVVATERADSAALHELAAGSGGRLEIEKLDIANEVAVELLGAKLSTHQFDLLFVNAGVSNGPGEKLGDVSTDEFIRVMTTNTLGPMRVIEAFAELVTPGGALGVMSKPVDPVKVLRVLSDTGPDGIVVLADDDPGAGPELEKIISGAGRACHLVRDSAEVLGGGTAAHSNILIFDLKTPLIQGLEVYRELHKSGHMAPAIIITASGPQYRDTVDAMRDVAITGILNKPFDPVGLLDRLDWLAA